MTLDTKVPGAGPGQKNVKKMFVDVLATSSKHGQHKSTNIIVFELFFEKREAAYSHPG